MFTQSIKATPSETDHHLQLTIQLLLCCAQFQPPEAVCDRIQTLANSHIDWQFLLDTALQHGVLPLVGCNLEQTCPAALPPDISTHIKRCLQKNTYRNLMLTKELYRLLSCFEASGMEALAFKGPMLALSVYHNVSLRQISDLDLLFRDQDIESAKELLLNQDYKLRIAVPWETHLVKENSIYNIDLHNVIAPKHLSHPLTNENVWQHVQVLSLAGRTVTSLSPEMNLLMLCLHGTKECWRHLNRICDVAAMVKSPTLEWDSVMNLARSLGYQRLVGVALQLAKDLLDAELPSTVTQWIDRDIVVSQLANTVNQRLFYTPITPVDEVERSLFHMQTRERWQDKAQTFLGLMNHSGWMTPTEADKVFLPLPNFLAFLYYPLRPIRIFQKYRSSFRESTLSSENNT